MKTSNDHGIGNLLTLDGQEFEVILRAPAFVTIQGLLGGERRTLSDEEYRVLVATGKVRKPSDTDITIGRIPDEKTRQEQRYRIAMLRRHASILATAAGEISFEAAIPLAHDQISERPAYGEYHHGRKYPTRRTIFQWKRNFREGGSDALLPEIYRRGNAETRHDAEFDDIVLGLLDALFLKNDRMSVAAFAAKAAQKYLKYYDVEQARRRAAGEEELKKAPHGRGSVEAILRSIRHDDLLTRRLPRSTARTRILKALQFHHVEYPLDSVEIDCHTAKCLVVDPQGNIVGRPTICAIIDAATGWILALVISLTAPKSELVVRALKECMVPQTDSFFDRHSIQNRVRYCGKPKGFVSDQGNENGGDRVESVLRNTRNEWDKAQPERPEDKPHIERFFWTLMQFTSTLPGATQTRLMPKRTRTETAEDEACLTLEEFDSLIQRWRYDVYGRQSRRRVLSPLRSAEAPIDCWKRLADLALIPDPPTQKELREIFMVGTKTRVLQLYGIEVEGVQYADTDRLRDLLSSEGPGTEVEIRYDPSDIREIAVLDPRTREHFPVRAKDPNILAIGFQEYKLLRKKTEKQKRQDIDAKSNAWDLAQEAHKLELARTGKSKKPSLKEARKLEQARLRHKEILDRSATAPEVNAGIKPAAGEPSRRTVVPRPANVPSFISR